MCERVSRERGQLARLLAFHKLRRGRLRGHRGRLRLPDTVKGGAAHLLRIISLLWMTSPLQNGYLSIQVPTSLSHGNTTSSPGQRQAAGLPALRPLPPRPELSSLLPSQVTVPAARESTRPCCRTHYLFSSGSDPHSTLLGFCSIHFNSIQDALQHAKRLGWAHWPPRHTHRPPTPRHPGLGHSTHGACLSTWPFTPCPAPQGGWAVRWAREWQVVVLGGERWRGVLGWRGSFRVLSCAEVPAERAERQG